MLPVTLGPVPVVSFPYPVKAETAYHFKDVRGAFVLLVDKEYTAGFLLRNPCQFTDEDRKLVPLEYQTDELIFVVCLILFKWFNRDLSKIPAVQEYCKRIGDCNGELELNAICFELLLLTNGASKSTLEEWRKLEPEQRCPWLLQHISVQ